MDDHVRAVRVGQREIEDIVLDVVLVVARLSEPEGVVAAGGDAVRSSGEAPFLVGACYQNRRRS
jgi:hypothetical protein